MSMGALDSRMVGAGGLASFDTLTPARRAALFSVLGNSETVSHFFHGAGSPTAVVAVTPERLIVIAVSGSSPPASVRRPFQVQVAKKGLVFSRVAVSGAHGESARWRLLTTDLAPLMDANAGADQRQTSLAPPQSPAHSVAEVPTALSRRLESWQDAEDLAAEHMRMLGFLDARRTSGGKDGGIDVLSRSAAAQVKFHAAPTGSPDVQRLKGAAYEFETCLFYATGYSTEAVSYANAAGVALFEFGALGGVSAVNQIARDLSGSSVPELSRMARWAAAAEPLSHETRVANASSWAKHLAAETKAPLSRWKSKTLQLEARKRASIAISEARAYLTQARSPIKSDRQRRKALGKAESRLIVAGVHLGVKVRLSERL